MRLLLPIAVCAVVAACGQTNDIIEVPKADLDCLASQTVSSITESIRESTAAGASPEDLQALPRDKTAEAVEALGSVYPGDQAAASLVTAINFRLEMIQDALNNRSPDSQANRIMDETFALAESCTFPGSV
ncbi:MAG: hypothetical protein AAF296_01305 [Pseudomonadota bacterium]